MVTQVLGISIVIIVAIIVILDFFPIIKEWCLRIHIGRYEDKKKWSEAILNKGSKWMVKTPTIKVTDNNRLVIIDQIRGNYRNKTIQQWQEASLILGLSELLKYNPEKTEVKQKIKGYLQKNFSEDGQWKIKPQHIDSAILAYALMKLEDKTNDRYKKAMDYMWRVIQGHIGSDGTVQYRKFMSCYRYVDTIGFICPFLILYGIRYKKPECIDLAVKQIKEFEKYGMLNNQFIPSHVYKVENKVPMGIYGWGRGLGWYAIGLIDSWNELPSGDHNKKILEESIVKYATSSLGFQQQNGSWNWTVTREESRADSSATATLCWFMLNASQISSISNDCLKSAEKAMDYLMKVTRRSGEIDFSQGDTKDIGVYSKHFSIMPFTQGFGIRSITLFLQQYDKKVG
jgi:unsaturated rhamnogalacturonyl hydrolase